WFGVPVLDHSRRSMLAKRLAPSAARAAQTLPSCVAARNRLSFSETAKRGENMDTSDNPNSPDLQSLVAEIVSSYVRKNYVSPVISLSLSIPSTSRSFSLESH